MMSIVILSVVIFIMVLTQMIVDNAFSSPEFPRHEIKDPSNDVLNLTNLAEVSSIKNPAISLIDLKSVNYFSTGKTLNATLWLGSPLYNNSNFYSKAIGNLNLTYGILIDADFNKNTGIGGADYGVVISWNNHTKTWSKLVNEFSSYDNTTAAASLRTLNRIDNYSHFFEHGRRYVQLSMDLNGIASPDHYRAMFFTQEVKNLIPYADPTNWVNIPPPHLEISTIPNSVSLAPGQEKNITVQINSTKQFQPDVRLFPKDLSINSQHTAKTAISLTFKDPIVHIPSEGVATVPLNITATQKAKPGDYHYRVYANTSFASEPFSSPSTRINLAVPFFGGGVVVGVKSISVKPAIIENETGVSNLLVTIPNPLTFTEEFTNFWTAFGGVVSLVAGGFAAGFSALIFDKLRKKKR